MEQIILNLPNKTSLSAVMITSSTFRVSTKRGKNEILQKSENNTKFLFYYPSPTPQSKTTSLKSPSIILGWVINIVCLFSVIVL